MEITIIINNIISAVDIETIMNIIILDIIIIDILVIGTTIDFTIDYDI